LERKFRFWYVEYQAKELIPLIREGPSGKRNEYIDVGSSGIWQEVQDTINLIKECVLRQVTSILGSTNVYGQDDHPMGETGDIDNAGTSATSQGGDYTDKSTYPQGGDYTGTSAYARDDTYAGTSATSQAGDASTSGTYPLNFSKGGKDYVHVDVSIKDTGKTIGQTKYRFVGKFGLTDARGDQWYEKLIHGKSCMVYKGKKTGIYYWTETLDLKKVPRYEKKGP